MNTVTLALGAVTAVGLFITFLSLGGGKQSDQAAAVAESGADPRQFEQYLDEPRGRTGWSAQKKSETKKDDTPGISSRLFALFSRHDSVSLKDRLDQTSISMRPSEWMLMVLGGTAVAALLFTWRTNFVGGLVAGLITAFVIFPAVLNFLISRRANLMKTQLAGALAQMSAGMRVGQSLNQSLETVANQGKPPLADEFKRVMREVELGMRPEEALARMVARNNSEDMALAVAAIGINRSTGGSLAVVFDSVSNTIRDRVRISGEIRVLTAQARFSGWIITLLPIGLGVLLTFIAPDYFGPMLSKPIGLVMLGLGGFSMLCGIAMIRRITQIDI